MTQKSKRGRGGRKAQPSRTSSRAAGKAEKVVTDDDNPATEQKPRNTSIPWDANKEWIKTAITYLLENPKKRLKLFSDSTGDAKAEGRKKVQASEGKIILYGELAEYIFVTSNTVEECWKEDFKANKTRYAKSLQQQFARLKKKYREYRRQFLDTGGGVKEGDLADNLEASIKEEWPLYEDLHSMWSELPSYNPIAVSNGAPGLDHSTRAASLFRSGAGTGTDDEDDEDGDNEGDVDEDGDPNKTDHDPLSDTTFWESENDDHEGVAPDMTASSTPAPKGKAPISAAQRALIGRSSASAKRPVPGVKEEKKVRIDEKVAKPKNLKRAPPGGLDGLDEIHILELKESGERQRERNQIRLKELDVERQRQELERERLQVKREKLATDQKMQELQHTQFQQMMTMMMGNRSQSFASNTPMFSSPNHRQDTGLVMDPQQSQDPYMLPSGSSSNNPDSESSYGGGFNNWSFQTD
ncbi:hypothetical protein BKA70DRAFT_1298872 [Coprinopsis sp. MPI-PUGE-AT-0042]|nr:hypothetical protein BKA70DRAFT_1298872 [Coprinopsis sp. MPI-PUGE-AT-0042]